MARIKPSHKAAKPRVKAAKVSAPQPSKIPSQRYVVVGVCVALAFACVAIYGQTLTHDFLNHDDPLAVTENYAVQAGMSWANVVWAFTNNRTTYLVPITWMSHMVDCELYGLHPWGHHLTSLILHSMNAILLFLVLARMTRRLWPSALVAALFAVHPLNVEAVAWVAERKGVLSALFCIAALGGYGWYRRRPNPARYLVVVSLSLLAMMSKPSVLTLPFVLLLLDYWPLERIDRTLPVAAMFRRAFRLALGKLPLLMLTAAFCAVTLSMTATNSGNIQKGLELSFPVRCGNALVVYVIYLAQMLWPLHLAVFYSNPGVFPLWEVAGAAAVLAGITAFCLYRFRRCPYLLVGWFWYLGTLVPVIGLVPTGFWSHADRYTYIPLVGIFFMLVWGAADLAAALRLSRRSLFLVSGAILAFLTVCSVVQTTCWRNSETLFRHALAIGEESTFAYSGLSQGALDERRYDEAESLLKRALELDPKNINALSNMGALALDRWRYDEAETWLKKALDCNPGIPNALNNLGLLYLEQRRYDEAETWLSRALQVDPRPGTFNNLGRLAIERGRPDEAGQWLAKALELTPENPDVFNNLGLLALNRGDYNEALSWFTKAARRDPKNVNALNNLGTVALRQARYDDAETLLTKALGLDPEYVKAVYNMGVLGMDRNRFDQAIPWFTKAVKMTPGNAVALNNLGWCLMNEGQYQEAQYNLRRAVEVDPQYTKAMINLADTLTRLGRREEGEGFRRKAEEINRLGRSGTQL